MGLFDPFTLGRQTLPNRIVMAPLTRNRAGPGNVPTELMATYYRQRAGAAFILSEATQVVPEGQGYPATPGIHSPEQVAGWRRVTAAVHDAGGRIWLQLWHVGRISHSSFHGGRPAVAPSEVRPAGQAFTAQGQMIDFETPRALEAGEVAGVIEGFRRGAANALDAGFDGVEVHGANGYLLDQFLRDGTNRRTDAYGGSPANRVRLLVEVTAAVSEVWGAERVGVRLSPNGVFNDMEDSDPATTFGLAAQTLDPMGLAYLHLVDGLDANPERPLLAPFFRGRFKGPIIRNGGYDRDTAEAALADGSADLVAFGTAYLANPDLPERLAKRAPLNVPDKPTFYGGGAQGYTDYPRLDEAAWRPW